MLVRAQSKVGQCLLKLPSHPFQVPIRRRLGGSMFPPCKVSGSRKISSLRNQRRIPNQTIHHECHQRRQRTTGIIRPFSAQRILRSSLRDQDQEQCYIKSTRQTDPTIHGLFEPETSTWQYIVADPASSEAVIIDPVLDYDRACQAISTHSADGILRLVKRHGYKIVMVLETHIHADHITAASYLQEKLCRSQGFEPPIGIGKRIEQVQKLFGTRYGVPESEYMGVFGRYFDDDETFKVGELNACVLHLPGHTPDHVGYRIGANVFCGDSILHADIGTARCDFPGGSATDMFHSGRKLLSLDADVKIWSGHDYPSQDRDGPTPYMCVRDHRKYNKHLRDGTKVEDYISLRGTRDRAMAEPKLLNAALQMNIRAGLLPEPASSGYRLLHLPLKWNGVL